MMKIEGFNSYRHAISSLLQNRILYEDEGVLVLSKHWDIGNFRKVILDINRFVRFEDKVFADGVRRSYLRKPKQ